MMNGLSIVGIIIALVSVPLAALVGGYLTRLGSGPAAGFAERDFRALLLSGWVLVVLATSLRQSSGVSTLHVIAPVSWCLLAMLALPSIRRRLQRSQRQT